MAKKEKKAIPEGMKCFKKKGGGSHRFPNRIIKSGQAFWCYPDAISDAFKDTVVETAADYKAVVISDTGSLPKAKPAKKAKQDDIVKFEMVKAKDEEGNPIKKGNSNLYNIVDGDGKAMNDAPLRKGKAAELLETLSS